MSRIKEVHNDWRDRLVPASFRGVVFHTEVYGMQSGRRTVVHEYAKRNDPYSEDMGKHAVRFSFTGYLIWNDKKYPDLINQRRALVDALEKDDAAQLVHPTMGFSKLCMCERYSMTETRQKGGYIEFDMQFVESGTPALALANQNTQSLVSDASNAASAQAQQMIDQATGSNLVPQGDRSLTDQNNNGQWPLP